MVTAGRKKTYTTATEAAFDAIKNWIVEGRLPEGERIDQEWVAQELGISRLPVRMALGRLEGEGLVDIQAHRGATVADLSGERLDEIYLLRGHLERLALELALPNLTGPALQDLDRILGRAEAAVAAGDPTAFLRGNREFHLELYYVARRPILLKQIANLWDMSEPYQRAYVRAAGMAAAANREHRAILAALVAGNREQALDALDRHNYGVRDLLKSWRRR